MPILARGRISLAEARQDRRAFRAAVPERPGIYAMLDSRGRVIYVGKSRRLRARLSTYLRAKTSYDKTWLITTVAAEILWEVLPDEFATGVREIELIALWQPRYNVEFQPSKRRAGYLTLSRGTRPRLHVQFQPPTDAEALAHVGPVMSRGRAREAAAVLNELLDQGDVPLKRAELLLTGQDGSIIEEIAVAMDSASKSLQFEEAARLRDRLMALRWLDARRRELTHAQRKYHFVYRVEDAMAMWYVIRGGRIVAALAEPRTREERNAAATLMRGIFTNDRGRIDDGSVHGLAFVIRWFRDHPDELEETASPRAALDALPAVARGP